MNFLLSLLMASHVGGEQVRRRSELVFLNLNNSPEEITACQNGLKELNRLQKLEWEARGKEGPPPPEQKLNIVRPQPKLYPGQAPGHTPAYYAVRRMILQMRKNNIDCDGIVLSADQSGGEFDGELGKFYAYELKDLKKEFPGLGLEASAVWGCYGGTVDGAETYWMHNIPNMQFTMAFAGQGPAKDKPANHVLLSQFCQRRQEGILAAKKDQLCAFYDSLTQLTPTALAVCSRQALVSKEYAEENNPKHYCFTYKELHERCDRVVEDKNFRATLDEMMNGDGEPPKEVPGKVTNWRKAYNDASKWRHCAEKYQTARGTDLPFPPDLIRLIKYTKVRKNLAKQNAAEIADYDQALSDAGLNRFALGDITQMSRKELNTKIKGAVSSLNNRRADPRLLKMALCMRKTLVKMDHACIPLDLVGDFPKETSACLNTYDKVDVDDKAGPC